MKVQTKGLKGSSTHVATPGRGNAKGGHSNLRSNATRKRLKMYKEKLKYDKTGNRIVDGAYASSKVPDKMARVQPDRRWFGNTRVIGQEEMDKFRDELGVAVHDPYTVLLREKKIPMGLLREPTKAAKMNLLQVEKFEDTFGKHATRKRPKIAATDYETMLQKAQGLDETYNPTNDTDQATGKGTATDGRNPFVIEATDPLFEKGQSKRIWGELYKVVDSSDVLVQVLDARDPIGTRSVAIENYIRREKAHKHMILLLNKCDLIPAWCTARWVKVLSREYPTLAFHASITNSFGKGALIQLLLQVSAIIYTVFSFPLSLSLCCLPCTNTPPPPSSSSPACTRTASTSPSASSDTPTWVRAASLTQCAPRTCARWPPFPARRACGSTCFFSSSSSLFCWPENYCCCTRKLILN